MRNISDKFVEQINTRILYSVTLPPPKISGVPRGGWGVQPPPRNSEGPPKSCHTQPDCENC